MNKKVKIIIYYLLEFVLSLMVFAFIALIITKTTIYSPDYLKQQFEKNNYYENLYNNIQDEMSKYIIPSGFPDEVVEDIYTEKQLKTTIEDIIDGFYDSSKGVKIDTSVVKDNLNKNIDEYLKNSSLEVSDEDSLDRFVDQMADIYESELTLSNMVTYADKILSKTQKLLSLGIVVLFALIALLALIIRFVLKVNTLSIPLFVSGVIIFMIAYYVNTNLSIETFYIWDGNVSILLRSIFSDILSKMNMVGIITVIVGTLDIFVEKMIPRKKKKHHRSSSATA